MSEYDIITGILAREGWPKFTDHPADRGGPTKGGVTLESWAAYVKRPVTPAEIEGLTETDVRKFYRAKYVVGPNFHRIEDPQLREFVIDAGVLHGVERASRWLQWAAEVKQDGHVGEVTLAAVNAAAPLELFMWLSAFRARLFGLLTSADPELKRARAAGFRTQAENTAGWLNRLAEFMESAARAIESDHNQRRGKP